MALQKPKALEEILQGFVDIVVCFNNKVYASVSKPAILHEVISPLSSRAVYTKKCQAEITYLVWNVRA